MKAIHLTLIAILLCSCQEHEDHTPVYSDPTMPLIQLPIDFQTYRQNSNSGTIEEGDYYDMLNVKGPGCVRSIWMLRAEGKRIEIVADGAIIPQVNMPCPDFFGTLLGLDPYHINSAPLVSMPNEWVKEQFGGGEPGYTSYFPIPFQDSCRIRIHAEKKSGLAAMVNWHKYDEDVKVTPYRFHVSHTLANPAPPRGSQISVADISGAGFIAGIFMGVIQLQFDDLSYHMGGITYLIDGETDPHAIRGHNMEDDYGFTWGFHETQTPWFGAPYHVNIPLGEINPDNHSIFSYSNESVVYRFMGPDPISFESSMSMKLGTRPDKTEMVVYYYQKEGSITPEIITPKTWQIIGTIPCETKEEFEKDLPIGILSDWKDSINIATAKFKVYEVDSDHSWLNFHPLYFTSVYTPFAKIKQAVFAKGTLEKKKAGKASLKVAFDDWFALWINGENIGYYYHEDDFKSLEIPVNLKKGKNEIIIKSVNFDKIPNMKLWAFSLKMKI
jgi:hypothetical protein